MGPSVSIVRCKSYDQEQVLLGLRRALDLIGGPKRFINRDDRVLLKPNLLFGKAPETAVTTHPSIVKGMIQIVREAGGNPFIGESPAIESLSKAADRAGIRAVAEAMNCPLLEFNRPILPQGEEKEKRRALFKQMEIDQAVFEADVIINLPKLKTHEMMFLTLGVKNLFGCIPGARKALWHLRAGEDRKRFARLLIDLYGVIHPSLTILDGIVGMEGNGPGGGDPIALGLILAAADPLHLDQIVCDLLGVPREALLTNRVAFEEGLGREPIQVVGERIEDVRIHRFRFPALTEADWNLPGFLRNLLKNALTSRPVFEEGLCEHCGRCAGVCPPKALITKKKRPVFDYDKCIRCFCCQEVCPSRAIRIKQGWALKLTGRRPSYAKAPEGKQ